LRILSLLAVLFVVSQVHAGKPVSEALVEKYQHRKDELVATEEEKRKVLASLYSVNQKMKKISQEKGRAVDRMLDADNKAKATAQKISELEEELSTEKKALRARLRALYRLSGEGYLAIIFSQNSGHNLDQTLKYLKIITARDYELIKSYQTKLTVLAQQKQKLKETVKKYLAVQDEIKQKERSLIGEHKSKTKLISSLEKRYAKQLTQLKKMRPADETDTDRELLAFLKPSFFEKKGELEAPVEGTLAQGFGVISDSKYKTQLSHKGWQLASDEGEKVSAVFDGEVAHTGPLPGYGQTIVIDHGDHYYTVYGHTKNLKIKTGDQVKKGDVLAEVAATSKKYGPGIYFEIRHFSEPENPRYWIKSKAIRISAHQGATSL
jgi:murein hydrolase activator